MPDNVLLLFEFIVSKKPIIYQKKMADGNVVEVQMAADDKVVATADEEKKDQQQQYFLAFDPGVKNLAVWAGVLSEYPSIVPKTLKLAKVDLTEMKRDEHRPRESKARMPLYEAASKLVLDSDWMRDASRIRAAIVETQAPRNVMSRVIAATIYGTLRGLGINVKFSSSRAKNSVMDELSRETGYDLVKKPELPPTSLTKKESAGRRRVLHRINKVNSEGLIKHVLSKCGDVTTLQLFKGCKADDMADAMMLGISLAMEYRGGDGNESKKRKRRRQQQQCNDVEMVVMVDDVAKKKRRMKSSDKLYQKDHQQQQQYVEISD